MIKIECLQSPDINALGIYEYGQNMIYLGRRDTDFTLQDYSLPENAMMIEVVEDQFYIHPQKSLEYFLINKKRCTGVKKIKRGDEMTIGETLIKLIDFRFDQFETKKQILDTKLKTIIDSNSSKIDAIRKLTELMNQKT